MGIGSLISDVVHAPQKLGHALVEGAKGVQTAVEGVGHVVEGLADKVDHGVDSLVEAYDNSSFAKSTLGKIVGAPLDLALHAVKAGADVSDKAVHFTAGAVDGVVGMATGLVQIGGGLIELGDPTTWPDVAKSVGQIVAHPDQFFGAAVGSLAAGFKKDPAEALGNLSTLFIPLGAAGKVASLGAKAGEVGARAVSLGSKAADVARAARAGEGAADAAKVAELGRAGTLTARAGGTAVRMGSKAADVVRAARTGQGAVDAAEAADLGRVGTLTAGAGGKVVEGGQALAESALAKKVSEKFNAASVALRAPFDEMGGAMAERFATASAAVQEQVTALLTRASVLDKGANTLFNKGVTNAPALAQQAKTLASSLRERATKLLEEKTPEKLQAVVASGKAAVHTAVDKIPNAITDRATFLANTAHTKLLAESDRVSTTMTSAYKEGSGQVAWADLPQLSKAESAQIKDINSLSASELEHLSTDVGTHPEVRFAASNARLTQSLAGIDGKSATLENDVRTAVEDVSDDQLMAAQVFSSYKKAPKGVDQKVWSSYRDAIQEKAGARFGTETVNDLTEKVSTLEAPQLEEMVVQSMAKPPPGIARSTWSYMGAVARQEAGRRGLDLTSTKFAMRSDGLAGANNLDRALSDRAIAGTKGLARATIKGAENHRALAYAGMGTNNRVFDMPEDAPGGANPANATAASPTEGSAAAPVDPVAETNAEWKPPVEDDSITPVKYAGQLGNDSGQTS